MDRMGDIPWRKWNVVCNLNEFYQDIIIQGLLGFFVKDATPIITKKLLTCY